VTSYGKSLTTKNSDHHCSRGLHSLTSDTITQTPQALQKIPHNILLRYCNCSQTTTKMTYN